jgi:hypothetical protein
VAVNLEPWMEAGFGLEKLKILSNKKINRRQYFIFFERTKNEYTLIHMNSLGNITRFLHNLQTNNAALQAAQFFKSYTFLKKPCAY